MSQAQGTEILMQASAEINCVLAASSLVLLTSELIFYETYGPEVGWSPYLSLPLGVSEDFSTIPKYAFMAFMKWLKGSLLIGRH